MMRPLLLLLLSACQASFPPLPETALDTAPAEIGNAFFGLDDAMPNNANRLCRGGAGQDGMPVTFSQRSAEAPLPEQFRVTTAAGVQKTPLCATLQPADADAERHTVLLIGDLGGVSDPPAQVTVVAPFPLDSGQDGQGLQASVTPLEDGPTVVLAIAYTPAQIETDCPRHDTEALIMVVWAGGVVNGEGLTDEDHRLAYTLTTDTSAEVVPFALGDLNDSDNYVHLCLERDIAVQRVDVAAAVVVDPRGDLNPATGLDIVTP